jgi:TRAP transporter TAXI family solute receptor
MAGKRIGIGPAGGTADIYVPSFLSTLGTAAPTVNGAWIDLAHQLENGGIDVLAVAAGVPFPAVVDIEPRRKVVYVPPTAEQILALRLAWPELTDSVIPPGTYPSLDRPYRTVGVFNFAIARFDLPDDLAYSIVDTVFSHPQEMLEIHPAAAATVAKNFIRNTFMPYHSGASRYYSNVAARGVVLGD